jgi:cobalt-zinc-cadmium efflux system outer membrane protein
MKFPYRGRLPLAVLSGASAAVLAVAAAWAEPAPPFSVLLDQAQDRAPKIAEADANVAQAQGMAQQAGVRPNPTVSLEVDNFSGTGPFQGLSGSETTASVSQSLELGDKRRLRASAGEAEVLAAKARYAQARADYAFELADAYAQAETSERRVQLAGENLAAAEEDARVAQALVTAGKEADLRAVQARAAVDAARADLEAARAARTAAFARLTALSGSPTPITSVPVSLLAHAGRKEQFSPPDPELSPAYLAALAAREAAARRVAVERSRGTPDVTVSLGVRRLAGDDATAMVGGISMPLPLSDRNRGGIAAAQAELRGADARLNGARLDAQADGRAAIARIDAADARLGAAHNGEAAAEEAYRLTRIAYEAGKAPLSELIAARRALTDARTRTLDAQLERLNAEAALARLQGVAPFGDHP